MIYLTGDTHIPIDVSKLNTKNFPDQKNLTRNDYVIVLGDFGLLWNEDAEYRWWKKWFEERNFTTLWIDGNHENHDWIDSLPVSEWNGGKVHVISPNIIHLMRGQVFTLQEHTFFTYGGAFSIDRMFRTIGKTWWPREEGNYQEENEAVDNLTAHNFQVDYILTHTCPDALIPGFFHYTDTQPTTTGKFLNYVNDHVSFKEWYFGHMHEDKDFGKYHAMYRRIERII